MREKNPIVAKVAVVLKGEPRILHREYIFGGTMVCSIDYTPRQKTYRFNDNNYYIELPATECKSFEQFKEYVRRYLNYGPSR